MSKKLIPFRQEDPGRCAIYCISNALNDREIIDKYDATWPTLEDENRILEKECGLVIEYIYLDTINDAGIPPLMGSHALINAIDNGSTEAAPYVPLILLTRNMKDHDTNTKHRMWGFGMRTKKIDDEYYAHQIHLLNPVQMFMRTITPREFANQYTLYGIGYLKAKNQEYVSLTKEQIKHLV